MAQVSGCESAPEFDDKARNLIVEGDIDRVRRWVSYFTGHVQRWDSYFKEWLMFDDATGTFTVTDLTNKDEHEQVGPAPWYAYYAFTGNGLTVDELEREVKRISITRRASAHDECRHA